MEKLCGKSNRMWKSYTFAQEQQNPSVYIPENYTVGWKTGPLFSSASITSQKLSVCVFVNQDGMLTARLVIQHTQTHDSPTMPVPSTCQPTLSDRAFPVAAAQAWNSLLPQTRAIFSLLTFRWETKSHLFRQSSVDWQLNCQHETCNIICAFLLSGPATVA